MKDLLFVILYKIMEILCFSACFVRMENIKKCTPNSYTYIYLRYRSPWNGSKYRSLDQVSQNINKH